MKKYFLILILIFNFSSQAKDFSCNLFLNFASSLVGMDETDQLITYFGVLLNENIMDTNDLKNFIDHLKEKNHYTNPLQKKVATQTSAGYQSENIEAYLKNSDRLDQVRIISWAEDLLNKKEQVKRQRTKSEEQTAHPYQKMKFHRIDAHGKINHSFEMMDTPVTQWIWAERTGQNGSQLTDANNNPSSPPIEHVFKGKKVTLWPNHAVNGVSWWAAAQFANQLSIEKGLTPVYDFNHVKFTEESIANGTWILQDKFAEIKINAPDGDIYKAEGYRLPTWEEVEYALTNHQTPGSSIAQHVDFVISRQQIQNRYSLNVPVADLFPLVINGNEFYDLNTGLDEWVHTPETDCKTYNRSVLLCKYLSEAQALPPNSKSIPFYGATQPSENALPDKTFRLVRSLPK